MKAVFVELPAFERHRADYLDDDAFRSLQNLLMKRPEAGDLMPDTGGLRKLRFADARRSTARQTDAAYACGRVQAGAEGHAEGTDSRARKPEDLARIVRSLSAD